MVTKVSQTNATMPRYEIHIPPGYEMHMTKVSQTNATDRYEMHMTKVSQTNATMPRYEMHIPPARDEACGAVRSAHLLKTVPSRRLCVSCTTLRR